MNTLLIDGCLEGIGLGQQGRRHTQRSIWFGRAHGQDPARSLGSAAEPACRGMPERIAALEQHGNRLAKA
jgi:hypothetical protein